MKKSPPVVLISGSTEERGAEFSDISLSLSLNYPKAIKAAGGVPSVLPCLPERDLIAEGVKRAEGILLTGGDDVQPSLYSKELPPELQKTVHVAAPDRDLFELMLIEEAFRQRKPLLAICRGHQILNVALGGTLIVDIPSQVPGAINHSRTDLKNKVVHEAELKANSKLAEITGKARLGVNSTHHQAVGKMAKPLRANAVSMDGIIEGMELAPGAQTMLPWLQSVQFHPERLFPQHAEHLEIFKDFIQACVRVRRTVV
ncbi:MAG TPA: gamma-glutamyl-gamma-aminobutyrate hydrolase family protein [Verrucomicrobiae bacterium]|nr:gamma-glutamyl-gamma-aminobutyrate hydrolase family protein [Verrucomicrobiae bacterium]